jgi:hypothetical protein
MLLAAGHLLKAQVAKTIARIFRPQAVDEEAPAS